MSWLVYALLTAALWTGWSFLGKIALRSAAPVQATILFGVASVLAGVAFLLVAPRTLSWSPPALWLAALSGTLGGVGLITFRRWSRCCRSPSSPSACPPCRLSASVWPSPA